MGKFKNASLHLNEFPAYRFWAKILLSLAFWMLAALLGSANANADQPTKVVLVTGDDLFLPFVDPTGEGGGLSTEIIRAAFDLENVEPVIEFKHWKRGYEETRNLLYEGTFPYVRSPERDVYFDYSLPLHANVWRFWSPSNKSLTLVDDKDFANRSMCIPRGWVNPEKFAIMPMLKFEEGSDFAGCLRMILAGRADFIISSEASTVTKLEELRLEDQIAMSSNEAMQVSHHILVPKHHPRHLEVLTKFNRGIQRLRDSGKLEEMIKQVRGVRVAPDLAKK